MKVDNPEISDDMLEYMIQQVDIDNDGKVSLNDFAHMIKPSGKYHNPNTI